MNRINGDKYHAMKHQQLSENDINKKKPRGIDMNEVLQSRIFQKSNPVYFLPCYLRFRVQSVDFMNLKNMTAKIFGIVTLTIHYGSLPSQIVHLLTRNMILDVEKEESFKIEDNKYERSQDTQRSLITFKIRRIFSTRMEGKVFWTPFERLGIVLSISVLPIIREQYILKFNLMDNPTMMQKIRFNERIRYQNYRLLQSDILATYSNKLTFDSLKLSNEQQLYKLKQQFSTSNSLYIIHESLNFKNAHFEILFYKKSLPTLAAIMIPLMFLSLINIGVFYQDGELGQKNSVIATVMVAFAATVLTIRNIVPPGSGMVFIEYVVYAYLLISILTLINALIYREQMEDGFQPFGSSLFIAVVILSSLTALVFLVLSLCHLFSTFCSSKKKFTEAEKKLNSQESFEKGFDRKFWKNEVCNLYCEFVNQHINFHLIPYTNRGFEEVKDPKIPPQKKRIPQKTVEVMINEL